MLSVNSRSKNAVKTLSNRGNPSGANVKRSADLGATGATGSLSSKRRKKRVRQSADVDQENDDSDDDSITSKKPRDLWPEYSLLREKRVLKDDKIDDEVEAWMQGGKTPAEAYIQVEQDIKRALVTKEEWKLQYVVSTMNANNTRLVCKYERYGLCSITTVDRDYLANTEVLEMVDFRERLVILDALAAQLSKESGKPYSRRYAHRYAEAETGETKSKFVTKEITLDKHRLRAAEWRYRHFLKENHQPDVLFENWTGEKAPHPDVIYFNGLRPSCKVKRAIMGSDEFAHYNCKESTCKGSCPSFLLHRSKTDKAKRRCCKIINKQGKTDSNPVECTDACGCDREQCGNRVLQHGAQFKTIVFFDYRKGWTLRTTESIKKGQFVAEYAGEVLTATEAKQRPDHTYFMDMPYPREVEDVDKKYIDKRTTHRKLVIDAKFYGNATRYISHDCDPNLELVVTQVERCGAWYTHMGFVATRDIDANEELTFDYYPHLFLEDRETNENGTFVHCFCNRGDLCKFSESTAAVQLRKDDVKKYQQQILEGTMEEGYDSWSEDDMGESERTYNERKGIMEPDADRTKRADNRTEKRKQAEEEEQKKTRRMRKRVCKKR